MITTQPNVQDFLVLQQRVHDKYSVNIDGLDYNKDVAWVRMVEDFVYELIPVVGFAMIASCIFILVVMRSAKDTFRFTQWFAMADLLSGIAMVYAGFHGVVMTIYGDAGEVTQPFSCFPRAFHLLVWTYTDCLQMVILCWFTIDRFLLILFPVKYHTICVLYLHRSVFLVVAVGSLFSIPPVFQTTIAQRDNFTVLIPSLCRFEDVISEELYAQYVIIMQWMPIGCIGICFLVLVIYVLRHTKQKWSYNWAEKKGHTKQLLSIVFVRAFLVGISIHVPLLFVYRSTANSEYAVIKDFLIRISIACLVVILQPAMYLLLTPVFGQNVYQLFNKYTHNTKRQWQSADDPPKDGDDTKEYEDGTTNMFGSWYSSAGNVTGEAGIPIERANMERSVSFYYQDSPKSKGSRT